MTALEATRATDDPTPARSGDIRPRWERRATVAICVAFIVTLFAQAPGRLVTDTKFDLYVDPVDFLHRATRLWESRVAFGYVPNQQWGYLFPIGPLFALGRLLGIPAWMVQRAWLSGLLIVALLGCRRLAREFGIGTPSSRLAAAAAYAVAPSMLIHLGQTSAGIPLATAVLPWIIMPLVQARERRAVSTGAAASALAFAVGGTVNATVALSVLVFPSLYLLLRAPGPRRRSLMRWWIVSIGAACIALFVGLVLLRRYGIDFTKITEQAADTAATVSATDVTRGTSDWLAYFSLGRPWNPAGNVLVHSWVVVLATGLVTALGVSGLARADLPERRCLGLTFGLGVTGQAMAFQGVWAGPFATGVQQWLDGPLSPLRNLSKLAPLVALPIALGLAHQLGTHRTIRWRTGLLIGAAMAIVAGSLPVMNGRLLAEGSYTRVPDYWTEAAAFLAQDPLARTLVIPSAPFAEYQWGRTLDEPLQTIGRSPSAARTIYPAGGSFPTTRLLDGIDAALARGVAVPGLAPLLSRSGIRYLLLRADLDRTSGSTEPAVAAAALAASPGLVRVRSFGPPVALNASADVLVFPAPLHQLEVYEVTDAPGLVSMLTTDAIQLRGGSDSLLNAALTASTVNRPVVVDEDGAAGLPVSEVAVSDGLRLRDRNFGDARGAFNVSYPLGGGEVPAGSGRLVPRDLTVPTESLSVAGDDEGHVIASSSFGALTRFPEAQPFAAFDGDLWTSWLAGPADTDGSGEWIQVNFDRPRDLAGTTVQLLNDVPWRPVVKRLRAITASGTLDTLMYRTAETQEIAVLSGESTFLRLEIVAVDGTPGGSSQVGISEVAIPGVQVRRPLLVPDAPVASTASYFFSRPPSPSFNPARWAEESAIDRLFTVSAARTFVVTATASLRQPTSNAVTQLFTMSGPVTAAATSSWFGRSAVSAVNAIDANAATAWVADPFDRTPTITVSWDEPQRITGITVVGAGPPTRTPTDVIVRAAGIDDQTVRLVDGHANLNPINTDRVEVEITKAVVTSGTLSVVTPPAVGIQTLLFDGAAATVDQASVPALVCGDGPTLRVDGVAMATRPVGSLAQILSGADVPLEVCPSAVTSLEAGLHRVSNIDGGPFVVTSVSLAAAVRSPGAATKRAADSTQWGDTNRIVHVDAGPASVLSVAENYNLGWIASFNGAPLTSVRLDGWHQGWVVPAGEAGDIRLEFRPTRVFRVGLVAWVLALALVVAVSWLVAHRSTRILPVMSERSLPWWMTDSAAAVALIMTGGLAVVMLPVLRYLRREPAILSVVCGVAFTFSTLISTVQHNATPGSANGTFSGLAQLSALVALGGVLAALTLPTPKE